MQELLPKNFPDRHELMSEGIAELRLWLRDRLAQGIAQSFDENAKQIDAFARRLVDTKLGEIARKLRLLAEKTHEENWPDHCLQHLTDWYLLSRTWPQLFKQEIPLQFNILRQAGLNIRKKDLLGRESIRDNWFVLHNRQGQEDQLHFQKTWLYGTKTQSYAYLLDYAWGDATFAYHFPPGSYVNADLVYYPSTLPGRAVLRPEFSKTSGSCPRIPGESALDICIAFGEKLKENPWLKSYPFMTAPCFVRMHHRQRYLIDESGQALPLALSSENVWQLVSLTAKNKISLFGLWSGERFQVLAARSENRWIATF